MRIAFVSTVLGYPWGGADTLWTRAAETATERGDQLFLSVSAAVASNPRISGLIAHGAQLLIREQEPNPSRPLLLLQKLGIARSNESGLLTALKKFRPDLIVFSQGGTYDLLLLPQVSAWIQASRSKYRIIANWQQEHPQLDAAHTAFMRAVFSKTDYIYFVSTRNLAVTREHLALPLQNARVIQNPLRWQPHDATPWPSNGETHLATVSRLDEGKGSHLLLEALAATRITLTDWRLSIFGQGPYESRLRNDVTRLGLGDRVQFCGYVPELRHIWSTQHLMVSPALEEGVPMTIPEAMLCRRPVLATRVGGAEDWLTHGRDGFLCPAPTVEQLTQSLGEAFAAREQWEAMGWTAAASAARHYRADDYLQLIT